MEITPNRNSDIQKEMKNTANHMYVEKSKNIFQKETMFIIKIITLCFKFLTNINTKYMKITA